MLDIGFEVRKGILFIRLKGDLTEQTSFKLKKEITDMIEDIGITNVVFNLSNVTCIDNVGIEKLKENFIICERNHGQAYICIDNKRIKNIFLESYSYENIIDNELNAFVKIII